ncbi:photosystem II protein Psb27 [Synechococcus sp. RSCCF101]|uniref:photosystem II protein Psb27 n=1 Tax=Synechococcus sp. RSCCF101 TaxID=2511069 RepID=UPI001248C5CF|nr:photosystem II protein Psb27 [Synechococcus sp. RSCCF101]QEY31387.1 photosystem II protein Psb27 [Synechococcus sp. RSCCF101]
MSSLLHRCRALALTLCLCLTLALGACSTSSLLSGSYVDDTIAVADQLMATIALDQDDPARGAAETEAKALINDYISRYRPQPSINGRSSFTTMQTALNSLAGHYASYANRPLPDTLRTRLERELKKAETSATRGA